MVISQLMGGLGNQLFQYAAGRALSLRLDAPLKLDTSFFKNAPDRTYELGRFNIQATVTTPSDDRGSRFWSGRRTRRFAKAVRLVGLPFGMVTLDDLQQSFDPRILSVFGDVYLRGFWQSERYFESITDIIRQEFTFRSPPDAENQVVLDQIQSTEAVVLHVRRGDYVADPVTNAYHGTCDLDYYRRAIGRLSLQVPNPHFFIFSDDPGWTRLNIRIEFPCTYVTHNTGRQDFEDLRLMGHGKHFIIANSSFSWWGAWLSKNPNKQIIAPAKWFANPNLSGRDLVPDRWLKI